MVSLPSGGRLDPKLCDERRRAGTVLAGERLVVIGLNAAGIDAIVAAAREIAALAARGLTNQQIADQLVLSVRTVETYVYRAMQKRGVSNRYEL